MNFQNNFDFLAKFSYLQKMAQVDFDGSTPTSRIENSAKVLSSH
jgi:hypothetical protein